MADMYQFGDWRVEPHLNRISRGDEEKQLEPKAMDVLAYLLLRNGETVTAAELLDQLWHGVVVEEDAVYQRIAKIRKALGDDARDPHYIQNIPRRGYRVIASVEPIDDKTPVNADLLATLEAQTPPFPAYDGEGSYIFVCYAHRDREQVYPELIRLRDGGANVWYDEGISPGSEWTEELANAISGCAQFLYYISEASVASRNCRDEVQFALKHGKPVVTVHIEPTELPGSLELSIGSTQALLKYEISPANYQRKLFSVLGLGIPAAIPTLATPEKSHSSGNRRITVAAVTLLAVFIAAGLVWLFYPVESARLGPRSVGVLPLADTQAEQVDLFADGLLGEILTQLHKIEDLATVGQASVTRYRGSDKSVAKIARELGVATLLFGKIVKAADRIRIDFELLEARTGEVLWADGYDRSLSVEQLFEIQTDIAIQIAHALQARLTSTERDRLTERPVTNEVAYNHYLRGESYRRKALFKEASMAYERAVEADRKFAPAWAGLALAGGMDYGFQSGMKERVEYALEQARKLAPGAADTHLAAGMVSLSVYGAYDEAIEFFTRVLDLQPGAVDPLHWLAVAHNLTLRFDQAKKFAERAVALDPFNAQQVAGLAFIHAQRWEFQEASRYYDDMIALEPDSPHPLFFWHRWNIYLWGFGDTTAAGRILEEAPANILTYPYEMRLAYVDRDVSKMETLLKQPAGAITPPHEWLARLHRLKGVEFGRQNGDLARSAAEAALKAEIDRDATVIDIETRRSVLAVALALAGDEAEAIETIKLAVERAKAQPDRLNEAKVLYAEILMYIFLGHTGTTIDRLRSLFSMHRPLFLTPNRLRLDPDFEPLWGNPDFEVLLAELSSEVRAAATE